MKCNITLGCLMIGVFLVGCTEPPGRDQIYALSMKSDTLMEKGAFIEVRHDLYRFLSRRYEARAAYDSLLIGRLYARLAFISRRDTTTFRFAEASLDKEGYPFYRYLPDTQRVHLYRWSARSAMATDVRRAWRLLTESYHLAMQLGDSTEMAKTASLWLTIRRPPARRTTKNDNEALGLGRILALGLIMIMLLAVSVWGFSFGTKLGEIGRSSKHL